MRQYMFGRSFVLTVALMVCLLGIAGCPGC